MRCVPSLVAYVKYTFYGNRLPVGILAPQPIFKILSDQCGTSPWLGQRRNSRNSVPC